MGHTKESVARVGPSIICVGNPGEPPEDDTQRPPADPPEDFDQFSEPVEIEIDRKPM